MKLIHFDIKIKNSTYSFAIFNDGHQFAWIKKQQEKNMTISRALDRIWKKKLSCHKFLKMTKTFLEKIKILKREKKAEYT